MAIAKKKASNHYTIQSWEVKLVFEFLPQIKQKKDIRLEPGEVTMQYVAYMNYSW